MCDVYNLRRCKMIVLLFNKLASAILNWQNWDDINTQGLFQLAVLCVTIACNHLPFFKIFSNNFQMFCPFLNIFLTFFALFPKNHMHALTFQNRSYNCSVSISRLPQFRIKKSSIFANFLGNYQHVCGYKDAYIFFMQPIVPAN